MHKVELLEGVAVQITGGLLRVGPLYGFWKTQYRLANPAKLKPRGKIGLLRSTKYCLECRRQLAIVARDLSIESHTVDVTIAAFLRQWEIENKANNGVNET